MTVVEDLNAGWLHAPPNPRACCHCLLLRDPCGTALVDAGIGLEDARDPAARVGRVAMDQAGFQFNPADTARRQLEARGIDSASVGHIIMTHLDPDHAGGLSDFPEASVHVSTEEWLAANSGDPRYRPIQFDRNGRVVTHAATADRWFGIPARRLNIGFASTIFLVPLFGHTAGHCGVAIEDERGWTLHVGDAYYLRAELTDPDHPVTALASAMAFDDAERINSLNLLRRLARDAGAKLRLTGYHDTQELPRRCGGSAGR